MTGLVGLALLTTFGSLFPLQVDTWSATRAELLVGLTWLMPQAPVVIALFERCLSFVPLGWLAARVAQRESVAAAPFSAWFGVVSFAAALELAQAPIAGRHARLSDLLLAAAFAGLGVAAARLGTGRPRFSTGIGLAAAALASVTVLLLLWNGHAGADPHGWDCSYPLVVANEATLDRPWSGSMQGLAIYPDALSADDLSVLAATPFATENGRALRRRLGALALYDFESRPLDRLPNLAEGAPVPVLASAGRDLQRGANGGLRLGAGSLLTTEPGAAAGLCRALGARRAFTLELMARSDLQTQSGPARLVSQSTDPLHRNFMLGQEGRALVFRVRTPTNGPNGTNLELYTGALLAPGVWRHVAATVAPGEASIFVDGARVAGPLRYAQRIPNGRGGSLHLAWLCLLILVAGGFAVGVLVTASGVAAIGVVASTAAALVGAAALPLGFDHAIDWKLLAVAGLGPVLGSGSAWLVRKIRTEGKLSWHLCNTFD